MASRLPTVGLLLFLLSACASVAGPNASWSVLSSDCRTDGRAVWLESPPKLDDLLLVGQVEDPSTTGGVIVPRGGYGFASADAIIWMRRAATNKVFVFMRPSTARPTPTSAALSGPYLGDPEGVYEWDLVPLESAACAPYRELYHQRRARLARAGLINLMPPEPSECVAYTYRGPLRLGEHQFMYSWWIDKALVGSGVVRTVNELRRGADHVIARAVTYRSDDPLKFAPECFHRSQGPEGWFPAAATSNAEPRSR
jgi:hypothetical protein